MPSPGALISSEGWTPRSIRRVQLAASGFEGLSSSGRSMDLLLTFAYVGQPRLSDAPRSVKRRALTKHPISLSG